MANIREFFHATLAEQVEDSAIPIVDFTVVKLIEIPVTNFPGRADAVAAEATVPLVSIVVPPGYTYYVQRAAFSGENKGVYKLLIDGVTQDTFRTWWCNFNGVFDFTGLPGHGIRVVAGKAISLQVWNKGPVGNFEGRIQVISVVNPV